ncbi:PREDICTED: mucin-5AC-like, partial [Tauraco erythrolophus]|uniref:mucin-5AC-like n=1 Tax=Tauraco erythrolophus TaxID=121530 RepID=UPI0005231DE4
MQSTTTITTPTPIETTSASSTTSTSRTTAGSTTSSTATSASTASSTVATQTHTSSITASTLPQTTVTTSTGTTVIPSTTAPPTRGTTIITTTSRASTTETSPAQTQSTISITTSTATETTSASSTTSTSRTTAGSTTSSTTTAAPTETSTVTKQTPTSPTVTSSVSQSGITSTLVSTDILPTSLSSTGPSTDTTVFTTVFTSRSSPGEVVYNRTDRAGCNFYALCSKECEIEPFQGPCPSTTPFTTVPSETTTQAASSTEPVSSVSPTTVSLTTAVERNCTDVNPPRKPGENWTSECQECVCDPVTATVQCQPLPCRTVQKPVCDLGFVPMPVLPVKDPCCPEFECQRIPDICVINGTMYKAGMSAVIDSCNNCTCSSEKDPVTKANIVHCERVQCQTSCPLGQQYMTGDGECCGKCIEVACVIKLSNNTVLVLNVDDILQLDNCSHYKCEKIEDQFVAVQTKRICPEYNPGECDPDEAETTDDGCCKICKPANCKPHTEKTVIRYDDCESSEAVELAYCEGTCPGSSV